jgi:3-deoxy-7-phosphoheptulonate synthase
MVEGYIEGGVQGVADNVYGKSITDPCLSWKDSEKLVKTVAEML